MEITVGDYLDHDHLHCCLFNPRILGTLEKIKIQTIFFFYLSGRVSALETVLAQTDFELVPGVQARICQPLPRAPDMDGTKDGLHVRREMRNILQLTHIYLISCFILQYTQDSIILRRPKHLSHVNILKACMA